MLSNQACTRDQMWFSFDHKRLVTSADLCIQSTDANPNIVWTFPNQPHHRRQPVARKPRVVGFCRTSDHAVAVSQWSCTEGHLDLPVMLRPFARLPRSHGDFISPGHCPLTSTTALLIQAFESAEEPNKSHRHPDQSSVKRLQLHRETYRGETC
jgi:hypothetical protein